MLTLNTCFNYITLLNRERVTKRKIYSKPLVEIDNMGKSILVALLFYLEVRVTDIPSDHPSHLSLNKSRFSSPFVSLSFSLFRFLFRPELCNFAKLFSSNKFRGFKAFKAKIIYLLHFYSFATSCYKV